MHIVSWQKEMHRPMEYYIQFCRIQYDVICFNIFFSTLHLLFVYICRCLQWNGLTKKVIHVHLHHNWNLAKQFVCMKLTRILNWWYMVSTMIPYYIFFEWCFLKKGKKYLSILYYVERKSPFWSRSGKENNITYILHPLHWICSLFFCLFNRFLINALITMCIPILNT